MRVGVLPLVASYLGNNFIGSAIASEVRCNEWFYGEIVKGDDTHIHAYMVPCDLENHMNYYSTCNNVRNKEINDPFITVPNSAALPETAAPVPWCPENNREQVNVLNNVKHLGNANNYNAHATGIFPFNLAVHRTDYHNSDHYADLENYYCIHEAGSLSGQSKLNSQKANTERSGNSGDSWFQETALQSKTFPNGYDRACVSVNYNKYAWSMDNSKKSCGTLKHSIYAKNWKDNSCHNKYSIICKMDLGEKDSANLILKKAPNNYDGNQTTHVQELDYVYKYLNQCTNSFLDIAQDRFYGLPWFLRMIVTVIVVGYILYWLGKCANCCMDEILEETKEEKLQRELEEEQRRQYIHRPLSRGEAWR